MDVVCEQRAPAPPPLAKVNAVLWTGETVEGKNPSGRYITLFLVIPFRFVFSAIPPFFRGAL